MAKLEHSFSLALTTYAFLIFITGQTRAFCPERCMCKLVPNPSIDCSKANLDMLPEGLAHFKGEILEEVNFSNNQNLKTLKHRAFEGLNISVLKLSSTGLTQLQPGVFSGVVAINMLYLDRNNMHYSNSENPLSGLEKSLEYLQLQGQSLQDVPHFIKHMHSLIEVDLSDNNIQELHDTSLHMIKARRVLLQRNNIHTVSRIAFVSTKPKELVDLSFNNITDISFLWDYCKVERVDLSENPVHCHCDLVVYRKAMPYPQVTGTCASPMTLEGTGIMSEDFVTKASKVCRVGRVTPITCPGPRYRVNIYTETAADVLGGDSLQSVLSLTSGVESYRGVLHHYHYRVQLILTVFSVGMLCSL